MENPTVNSASDKLRVLCVHGYRQNEFAFKSKLGSFRKFLSKYAEFEFVNAPHVAPALIELDGNGGTAATEKTEKDEQRSWWFNKDDGTFKGTNRSGPAVGFETSLRLVEKDWIEKGPFQGLLGFSQGACLAGLICHLSAAGKTQVKPDFTILASGFRSGSLVHLNYYDNKITIPSLHIYGQNDEIITKDMSELLASSFQNKQVIIHEGGHYFPATAQLKQTYIHFFQDRLQEYLEAKEIANANETNTVELNTSAVVGSGGGGGISSDSE